MVTLALVVTILGVGSAPTPDYWFYVASESEDQVALVRLTPGTGLVVEKVIPVGTLPADIEAPHGVFVDPMGSYWYATLGHGVPFGSLMRFVTDADTLVDAVTLGMFPATVAVPPFGGLALVVNSDFHGDLVPSTVSAVDLESMTEIGRTETCVMPHGSRFSADGLKHYSVCMVDDQLVELDVASLEVSRRLDVVTGNAPRPSRPPGGQVCSPTWAAPSPNGGSVYVTCNRSNEVVEVDTGRWEIARRFAAPNGPYNAEVTPNGERLVVTQKGSGAVAVWDLATGERVAFLPTVRKVTHGVAITPDGRFAVVTVEGIGGEPGAVEAFDLEKLGSVGSVDVGKQAGGIAFWKVRN